MRYRYLGRTGLRVSLLSLGTGGPSQLGQASGVGEEAAARMLRRALELGVNFIDSSSQYGDSETLLGRMLADVPRDQFLIATKFPSAIAGRVPSGAEVTASVEGSLARLGVDAIDLLQFHGVIPELFDEVMETQLPTATRLLEQGKCRLPRHVGELQQGPPPRSRPAGSRGRSHRRDDDRLRHPQSRGRGARLR